MKTIFLSLCSTVIFATQASGAVSLIGLGTGQIFAGEIQYEQGYGMGLRILRLATECPDQERVQLLRELNDYFTLAMNQVTPGQNVHVLINEIEGMNETGISFSEFDDLKRYLASLGRFRFFGDGLWNSEVLALKDLLSAVRRSIETRYPRGLGSCEQLLDEA